MQHGNERGLPAPETLIHSRAQSLSDDPGPGLGASVGFVDGARRATEPTVAWATRLRLAVWVVTSFCAGACIAIVPRHEKPLPPPTPIEVHKALADGGDAGSMVIVGYLLATGLGTVPDLAAARTWFEQSARLGHPVAHLNLAILHHLGGSAEPDVAAARREFRRGAPSLRTLGLGHVREVEDLVTHACQPDRTRSRGQEVYETFCSGCHGVTGVATYGLAPSFALGERTNRDVGTLLETVAEGHAAMPQWDDKLPSSWLEEAVQHARSLPDRFSHGLLTATGFPTSYFRFGPMADGQQPTVEPQVLQNPPPSMREACARMGG